MEAGQTACGGGRNWWPHLLHLGGAKNRPESAADIIYKACPSWMPQIFLLYPCLLPGSFHHLLTQHHHLGRDLCSNTGTWGVGHYTLKLQQVPYRSQKSWSSLRHHIWIRPYDKTISEESWPKLFWYSVMDDRFQVFYRPDNPKHEYLRASLVVHDEQEVDVESVKNWMMIMLSFQIFSIIKEN